MRYVPLVALLLAACAHQSRPNFILFVADDVSDSDLHVYGHPHIRTPRLDRLSAEGMRFDRAYVTASSCSPSRASVITGKFPHDTKAEELHWPLPRDQVTFPSLLKKAGYYTAASGKWHLGDEVKDQLDLVHDDGWGTEGTDGSGAHRWVPLLRERPRDRPFFFWFAAHDAHRPYPGTDIPGPKHTAADVVVPPYMPDDPAVRSELALYYDEIARLDTKVGEVLDELERQGLAGNTVVAFFSDNGRPFPRCKTTMYECGLRTPLIVRWPALVKAGGVTRSLTSTVDIAPTFLEIAGVERPTAFRGTSFLSVLRDPAHAVQDRIFAEQNWHDYAARGRAVRTSRWKYIQNEWTDLPMTPPADAVKGTAFQAMRQLRDAGKLNEAQMRVFEKRQPEELYDAETDPDELKNLAGDPQHAAIVSELRASLDDWRRRTDDRPITWQSADEFDRETAKQLPNRVRPRIPPKGR